MSFAAPASGTCLVLPTDARQCVDLIVAIIAFCSWAASLWCTPKLSIISLHSLPAIPFSATCLGLLTRLWLEPPPFHQLCHLSYWCLPASSDPSPAVPPAPPPCLCLVAIGKTVFLRCALLARALDRDHCPRCVNALSKGQGGNHRRIEGPSCKRDQCLDSTAHLKQPPCPFPFQRR